MTLTELYAQLQTLCVPLTYISETDSPVEAWKAAGYRHTDPTSFRKAAGYSSVRPIEQVAYDQWIGYLSSTLEEWQDLDTFLRSNLTELVVYKVPDTDNPYSKTVYAVGMFGTTMVGIKTHAVET